MAISGWKEEEEQVTGDEEEKDLQSQRINDDFVSVRSV